MHFIIHLLKLWKLNIFKLLIDLKIVLYCFLILRSYQTEKVINHSKILCYKNNGLFET